MDVEGSTGFLFISSTWNKTEYPLSESFMLLTNKADLSECQKLRERERDGMLNFLEMK